MLYAGWWVLCTTIWTIPCLFVTATDLHLLASDTLPTELFLSCLLQQQTVISACFWRVTNWTIPCLFVTATDLYLLASDTLPTELFLSCLLQQQSVMSACFWRVTNWTIPCLFVTATDCYICLLLTRYNWTIPCLFVTATDWPPRWPSGKASASRAEDPGFEFRLRRDFFGVESYQWLKNWHSSGYPARRLALKGQRWDWSARCLYTVTGWDGKFGLQLLSQCGST